LASRYLAGQGVAHFGFRQVIRAHAVAGMTGESYHRCRGFPPLASPWAAVMRHWVAKQLPIVVALTSMSEGTIVRKA
jgi:hypothetical protein